MQLHEQKIITPIKINLTLHVLSKKTDGYHEIHSLFWRKNGLDWLTISASNCDNICDQLLVRGIVIKGNNILTKTLNWVRELGYGIPPLQMQLDKNIPTGSGVGAGSGNASALLSYLKEKYNLQISKNQISKLGADIPFLFGNSNLAIISGIGEKTTDIPGDLSFTLLLVFPKWALDMYREASNIHIVDDITTDIETKKQQLDLDACNILHRLKKGEKVGLLPNDFFPPLLKQHPEYNQAIKLAKDSDALAFGLSGSGSAFFALYKSNDEAQIALDCFNKQNWIKQINILE